MDILQQLPFANASLVDSSLSSENSFSSGDDTIFLPGYQKLALEHAKNFKIGHINANSIGRLKFEEITHWLELNYFDLLVITETKLNSTFPDSQFQVHGFRLLRNDRNRCGGGVAMFIRSNIPFMRAKRLESFIGIECVAVRLKLSNSWTTFVGLYRPPSLEKSTWKFEMCNLFETVTEMSKDVFILGDFNCDMLNPNKPPNQGRDLMDIMDIFAFENLISGATRITDNSQTLLDLVLTNSKLRVLQAGVSNPHVSDHALVYAILRVFSPKCRSQKICFRSMKNFDVDKFCDDLNYAPFVTVMNSFEDVNDNLFAFESMYTSILDEHAPMKTVRVRGNQVPFMNDEWRNRRLLDTGTVFGKCLKKTGLMPTMLRTSTKEISVPHYVAGQLRHTSGKDLMK